MTTTPADKPLSGRTALITGASRGIGAATARALAAAGAHVVLTARNTHLLEEVEESIHQSGGHATIAPLDLAEPDAIARLALAMRQRWDTLDVLVLSAATLPALSAVTQIEPQTYSHALTVNVLATQAILAGFNSMLKRSSNAQIIGLTSSVGATPRAYWAAYGSAKAAFESLLDCYAQEVENISSVKVAILDPGATRTAMRAKAYPGEDPATVKPPEDVAQQIVDLLISGFPTRHRQRLGAISSTT